MNPSAIVQRFLLAAITIPATLAWSAESADKTFDVWEYRVNGNTVLQNTVIESAVYPYLGPHVDLTTVEAARAALESAYRERGYVTVSVTIPEQTVGNGFVTLDVVEQRVQRLRVTGAKYSSQRAIAAALPSLSPGRVLNTNDVQQDLNALSRRSRDASYDPRVKAGRDVGTLDVDLAVKDQLPLHGRVELNNFRSANTSDLRLSATASYSNLFQRQQTLVLSSQVSPQETNEVKVFSATYVARPEVSRNIFSITGVHTDSDVAAVGGTTVLGKGDFVFARGIVPLHEHSGVADSLVFGIDYKDSKDQTTFLVDTTDGVSRADVSEKAISYVNLVLGYNAAFSDSSGTTNVDLTGNFGSRQLFNDVDEFELKRFKGEPNYVHVDFDASRVQRLPWHGLRLTGRLKSQWSPDQLIANEQFNLGGFTSVRGYLESEDLGDYGWNTSIELASGDLAAHVPTAARADAYLFWDWGNARINNPLPDEDSDMTLSSLGIGVRLATVWGLDAEGVWTHALHDGSSTERGDDRLLFMFGYDF